MNTQARSKILLIIIGILLVANMVLLSLYMKSKPGAKESGRPDRNAMTISFLKNDLGFTPRQLQQYDTLNSLHRTKIKAMFDGMKIEKENQFKTLAANNFSDSSITTVAAIASDKQKQIQVAMFTNYKNIRSLCTPQQQPKFDSLFFKMLNKRNEQPKK